MLTTRPDVVALLNEEFVGWLTTVTPDGQPQSSPVWHWVDGDSLIVYSRSDARRLDNIAANPRVAYNLRGDFTGDIVVTMEGNAKVDPGYGSPLQNPDYMTKYSGEISRFGWTQEEFDSQYSVPLRIEITRVRAELG